MGCCFSPNEPRIKIFDQTPAGQNVCYLRMQRTITFSINSKYNVPLIDIQFDGWYDNSVCLWPEHNKQRENILLLESVPLSTPSVSSFSDSGVDTVFKYNENGAE